MKITQSKGYRKPLYVLGIAATLAAVSVTGCGLDTKGHEGHKGKRVDSGLFCKHDADNDDIALGGEVDLAGEETMPTVLDGIVTVDDVTLDGDVSVDYTVNNNDNVILDGGAPIDDGT